MQAPDPARQGGVGLTDVYRTKLRSPKWKPLLISSQYPPYMLRLSPHVELHPLFEALGYSTGFVAYRWERRKSGEPLTDAQRWSVIAAAATGALVGSRLLGLAEEWPRTHIAISQIFAPSGGKTIVGGLLGGWLAVEIVKRFQGIRTRTGDLFAVPLGIGIAVGRIGCLLAGLADDTYGKPTSLPWGVDFGDGIARHPTQAYEILFLAALAPVLLYLKKRGHPNGLLFRLFMAAYLTWRLSIDFLKPEPLLAGMSLIQWACVGALAFLIVSRRRSPVTAAHAAITKCILLASLSGLLIVALRAFPK